MNEQAQAVVDDYMRRLKKELKALPRAQREEILEDINQHVDQSLGRNGSASEADARTILDQLGDPSEIAGEARQRLGIERASFGAHEIAAVILLPLGALALGFGWIAGVILLWTSKLWTTGEKLIGTFLPPGGLITMLLVLTLTPRSGRSCTTRRAADGVVHQCSAEWATRDILQLVLVGLLIAASIAVPIWLGVRARRRAAA
jgi:hypothetical protein